MFTLWYGALVYKEYRKDKLTKNTSTTPLDNVTLPPTTKIPSPIPKIPPPTTKIPSPSRSPVPTMDLPAKIPPVLATSTPKPTTFDSVPKRTPAAAPQLSPPSPPPPLPPSTINSIEGVEYYEEGEDEDEDEDDVEEENSELEDENSVISASPWKPNQNK